MDSVCYSTVCAGDEWEVAGGFAGRPQTESRVSRTAVRGTVSGTQSDLMCLP